MYPVCSFGPLAPLNLETSAHSCRKRAITCGSQVPHSGAAGSCTNNGGIVITVMFGAAGRRRGGVPDRAVKLSPARLEVIVGASRTSLTYVRCRLGRSLHACAQHAEPTAARPATPAWTDPGLPFIPENALQRRDLIRVECRTSRGARGQFRARLVSAVRVTSLEPIEGDVDSKPSHFLSTPGMPERRTEFSWVQLVAL